ncbi:hypothetical protein K456DRAFT_919235 [Colletotrichum gloeosporioides 23]|nr:hypothetical protein K456DRAFT_919235 [Colletotrichum gloeosporioides 23]
MDGLGKVGFLRCMKVVSLLHYLLDLLQRLVLVPVQPCDVLAAPQGRRRGRQQARQERIEQQQQEQQQQRHPRGTGRAAAAAAAAETPWWLVVLVVGRSATAAAAGWACGWRGVPSSRRSANRWSFSRARLEAAGQADLGTAQATPRSAKQTAQQPRRGRKKEGNPPGWGGREEEQRAEVRGREIWRDWGLRRQQDRAKAPFLGFPGSVISSV